METLWFVLVALMLTAYVVLDGFDLGAGVISLFVAQGYEERNIVLKTIGPVWDGNEVWLIAAGGALYFAFPSLYAAAFSGFYLPLMIVLWLLMLRGIGVELRSTLIIHCGGPHSTSCLLLRACCSRYSSGRPSGMSCAAFRSIRTVFSSKRCGPIFVWVPTRVFSIGTRRSPACSLSSR